MEHVIEHPHKNATKTVTINTVNLPKGHTGYRISIVQENYSGADSMYSKETIFHSVLYEEELDGLITALNKAKMAKLLGVK